MNIPSSRPHLRPCSLLAALSTILRLNLSCAHCWREMEALVEISSDELAGIAYDLYVSRYNRIDQPR